MKGIQKILFCLFFLVVPAGHSIAAVSALTTVNSHQALMAQIDSEILESYDFYGLATYFNQLHYFSFSNSQLQKIDPEKSTVKLNQDTWLLVVGRFNVLIIQSEGQMINIEQGLLQFDAASGNALQSRVVVKSEVGEINDALVVLRYHQLFAPLAMLSRAFEWGLKIVGNHMNWGAAIIVFALLIKILLLPINILTIRSQRKVSMIQAKLIPELAEIKSKYDGEEAHNKIMAAHKNQGVSPFFTLKPLMSTLIQLPVLIAIFNVLGEMPQLKNASFLWINDLAYPDQIAQFSIGISLFGDKISLLPVLMTIIALLSAHSYKDTHLPEKTAAAQRKKLLLMAVAFFVLFYPFPASMVLYWATANVLQYVQHKAWGL